MELKRIAEISAKRRVNFDGKQYFIRLPKKLVEALEGRRIYCGRYSHDTIEIQGIYELRTNFDVRLCVLLVI